MPREWLLLGLGLVLLGANACGGGDSESPAPPPPDTRNEAPAPVVDPPPAPPPTPATKLDLSAGDAVAGERHYQQYCATCHGSDGTAQTPMAAALDPRPADHSAGSYMNALSDEHLFKVIKLGGFAVDRSPLMAPWGGTLSDQEIVDVIAFVRGLADPPYPR